MASRKASRPKLTVVGYIGTSEGVVDLLSQALHRAEEDETLAVALVEIRREGVISTSYIGDGFGHRHSLYAGCGYLMRDIGAEDEE